MEDKLQKLKTHVRCLLISSPSSLTVHQFMKDYQESTGELFPFLKFGFNSPSEFLLSMPDVVVVTSAWGGDVLTPVESPKSKTAHINKLVLEQKSTKGKPVRRRPRPVQLPTVKQDMRRPLLPTPMPLLRPPMHPMAMRGWEKRVDPGSGGHVPPPPNGRVMSHQISWFDMKTCANPPNLWMSGGSYMSFPLPHYSRDDRPQPIQLTNGPSAACLEEKPDTDQGAPRPTFLLENESVISNWEDSASVMSNFSTPSPSRTPTPEREKSITPPHSCHETDGEISNNISNKMKDNFRLILKKHRKGVLVSKLPSLYKKMFGVWLDHYGLGYQSMRELVMSCSDVFKVEKGKHLKDWLLYDPNCRPQSGSPSDSSDDEPGKWVPNEILENLAQLTEKYPEGISGEEVLRLYQDEFNMEIDFKKLGFDSVVSFLVNCQNIECKNIDDKCLIFPKNWVCKNEEGESAPDPLLSMDNVSFLWRQFFREDVCDPVFRYKKFILPEEAIFKVMVVDVVNPESLWIQKVDQCSTFNEFMFELNTFYDEQESKYLLNESVIRPGQACCTKFSYNDRWHRAFLQNKSSNDKALVQYIDYGTTEIVDISNLRGLHKKFSDLPIQALRAKLYDLAPMEGSDWPENVSQYLYEIVADSAAVAEIIRVDREEPMVEIILINTMDQSDDVIINELFKNEGLARSVLDSANNVECNEKEEAPCEMKIEEKHFSYPEDFSKLLPYWLVQPGGWNQACLLMDEAKAGYRGDREGSSQRPATGSQLRPPTCCTQHLVSHVFIHQPKLVCELWYKAINSNLHILEEQFLNDLSAELVRPLPFQNLKRRCYSLMNEERGTSPMVPREEPSPQPQMSAEEREVKKQSPVQNGYPQNGSVVDNLYDSQPHSHSSRASSERQVPVSNSVKLERMERLDGERRDSEHVQQRPPRSLNGDSNYNYESRRIIEANLHGKKIHLILFEDGVYLVYKQLVSNYAGNVAFILAKHRLSAANMFALLSPVDKTSPLYQKLVSLQVFNATYEPQPFLVPLCSASSVLSAIEPRNLAVVSSFNKLAEECTPDHEFWYS